MGIIQAQFSQRDIEKGIAELRAAISRHWKPEMAATAPRKWHPHSPLPKEPSGVPCLLTYEPTSLTSTVQPPLDTSTPLSPIAGNPGTIRARKYRLLNMTSDYSCFAVQPQSIGRTDLGS